MSSAERAVKGTGVKNLIGTGLNDTTVARGSEPPEPAIVDRAVRSEAPQSEHADVPVICALAARCRRGAARSGTRTEERLLLGDILDRLFGLTSRSPRAPNLGRRPAVHFNKDGVEPSQAPEARPHRDLGHWQAGLVEEAFGSLHARGPCHF